MKEFLLREAFEIEKDVLKKVLPVASLVSVVPLTIGGLGLVEAGLTGMILLYGVSFEMALAFALLTRAVKQTINILAGAKTLFLRKKANKRAYGIYTRIKSFIPLMNYSPLSSFIGFVQTLVSVLLTQKRVITLVAVISHLSEGTSLQLS